ncbi:MAG: AAA family ATPase [Saprospiraceae bacterium]|nr:AAA family ATPase [Saprospiraceae bacterium]
MYHRGIEDFENHIKQLFQNIATSYNLELREGNYLFQFQSLISKLYEKFNRGVIVLIDEYDKPIVDFINEPAKAEENRAFLREFYTTLKAEHAHLRLVFVTGVSKLAKVSVFSGMNNTLDVSLYPKMNDLVGITYEELVYYFENQLATLQEKNECSRAEILAKIKYWYNGYSWDGKIKFIIRMRL